MKKGLMIIFIFLISGLCISFVSANWFNDLFNIGEESNLEGRLANLKGDVCECSDCAECTEMLNNEKCSEVILTNDITLEKGSNCILNPKDFNNKIFDCQEHGIKGKNRGIGVHLKGKEGIIIKNCKISNFNKGIYLYDVNDFVVENNQIENNLVQGIRTIRGQGKILKNIILGGSYGLQMSLSGGASGYAVSGNQISRTSAYGIWMVYGKDNVINNNKICDNNKWDIWTNAPALKDNTISDNSCDKEKSSKDVCEKTCEEDLTPLPIPIPQCDDKCGNGLCDEIVCLEEGCPCP
jgi:parallel beta-helix repeat protein